MRSAVQQVVVYICPCTHPSTWTCSASSLSLFSLCLPPSVSLCPFLFVLFPPFLFLSFFLSPSFLLSLSSLSLSLPLSLFFLPPLSLSLFFSLPLSLFPSPPSLSLSLSLPSSLSLS